ncbi:MAG: diaminopimelate epimerase [Bacillota bacterium]|jgi:diaminopimelate epimerase
MLSIEFTKMAGCGNDFIILDNRSGQIADPNKGELARKLCRRRLSLGADGMIFVENSLQADIRMDFYNADGSNGEMCGNGLRCFARYVADMGICPKMMRVETDAGLYLAQVEDQQVRLAMPPVELPKRYLSLQGLPKLDYICVGVPHAVVFSDEAWTWPDAKFHQEGLRVRQHRFFPNGTNVNFVARDNGGLRVRTFERGVEAETLACGTGATASALVASLTFPDLTSPISVETRGGTLQVGFQRSRDRFIDVWLQGNALIIARGTIQPDAL